jgi:hypothetical protein
MFLKQALGTGFQVWRLAKTLFMEEITKIDRSCFRYGKTAIASFKTVEAHLIGRVMCCVMHFYPHPGTFPVEKGPFERTIQITSFPPGPNDLSGPVVRPPGSDPKGIIFEPHGFHGLPDELSSMCTGLLKQAVIQGIAADPNTSQGKFVFEGPSFNPAE